MSSSARLHARPAAVPARQAQAGSGTQQVVTSADLDARPALVHVPAAWRPGARAGLAVMLHGSGGAPEQGLSLLEPYAAEAGIIVLAPASRGYTWDGVLGRIAPDPQALDIALRWVFDRYAVNTRRIAVGGFSDGASYALTLALANGTLFSHGIALSPGFIPPGGEEGKPALFVSHGTADRVLPIERCSRRIVPFLRGAAYTVDYREFEGGHEVPPSIAGAAVKWFLA